MAYTDKELSAEFWLLTKGVLQDSRIDTDEAVVIKRWLEEHQQGGEFAPTIDILTQFLADGFISEYESRRLMDTFGRVLATLRLRNANV